MCAFDFDNTLRVERDGRQDAPAGDAGSIIADCQAKGYAIAIASANGDAAKIKPVLRRIDGATFSGPFFGSGAFQIGEADKARELRRVGEHFGTPAACMMLFDDGAFNKRYADETGSVFRQVDGRRGVAWSDYQSAQEALARQCACDA